jgi:hypothetical protein
VSGRGRWYRTDKRALVSDYRALRAQHVATTFDPDTAGWHGWGWWRGDGEQVASIVIETLPGAGVRLRYSANGQAQSYVVRWAITTPHYGGKRYWWECPKCGRRVAILYGGAVFCCRRCHGLTYATAQSGDPQEAIDNRLLRIRKRLCAPTAAGWPDDGVPSKPKGMHWDTYSRLAREYLNLLELRNTAFLVDALGLMGSLPGMTITPAEAKEGLRQDLAEYRQDRARLSAGLVARLAAGLQDPEEAPAPARLERYTLGELAARAGVPYAFAKEAAAAGLIRPDAGRTKRAKRYRGKVAGWLGKLQALRAAGLPWEDIRAWAARRFLPGNEQERRWPAGYDPGAQPLGQDRGGDLQPFRRPVNGHPTV